MKVVVDSTWALDEAGKAVAHMMSRRARGQVIIRVAPIHTLDKQYVHPYLFRMQVAGLVSGRRDGRCVCYRVEPRGMKPLIDWIVHYRAYWTEHVDPTLLARIS